METEASLDIDSLKMPHESEIEWGLRRSFLVAHQDKFDKNRLLCLASCFVNIEIYGNRYPDPVMVEMGHLTEDIKDEATTFREKIKERSEVKFVKASDSSSASSKERGKKMTGFVQSTTKFQDTGKSKKEMSEGSSAGPSQQGLEDIGPQAANKYFAQDTEPERSEIDEKFYTLAKILKEIQSSKNPQVKIGSHALHMATDKVRMAIQTDIKTNAVGQSPICSLQIDFIHVATSLQSLGKKKAKTEAYNNAVELLYKRYLRVVQLNPEKRELQGSDTPFGPSSGPSSATMTQQRSGSGIMKLGKDTLSNISPLARGTVQGKRTHFPTNQGPANKRGKMHFNPQAKALRNFVIVERKYHEHDITPASLLRSSGDFCKMNISFQHEIQGEDRRCVLTVEGHVLADVSGTYKQTAAESVAAEHALETLRKICYTIHIKQLADTEDSKLSMEEVLGDNQKSDVIPDSNIGNKLLKMMGWSGGGLGKNSQGIAEPVSVSSVIRRAGLGMAEKTGHSGNFLQRMKGVLLNYAKSENEGDLTFSSEFDKEERALIHRECLKLGLKSQSSGKGTNRFMIVSRKRTVNQLLAHVMQQGGETSKYLLIPPSGTD